MTEFAISLKSHIRRYPGVTHVSRGLRKTVEPGLNWVTTHLGSRSGRCFSQPSNYFVRNRVAGYIGWVGNGNVGDEAIFMAFRRLFPRYQAMMFDRHPYELQLHRKFVSGEPFFDFVTLGGGTLFSFRCYYYQLDTAVNLGVPVWTFGTGLDDPGLMDPQGSHPWTADRQDHFALLRDFVGLLKRVSLVTVRGPRTARVLKEQGLSGVQVIGDPALGACEATPPAGGRRAAINLAMWKDRGGPETEHIISALGASVRYLLDRGWHVDFVPTARGDRVMAKRLQHELLPRRINILPETSNPEVMIQRLRSYDMLIGERLHSLVLASGSGVPSIGLEYSPKCRDFMESLGMERFCIRGADVTADSLIAAVDEADKDRQDINRSLNDRCNVFRRKQRDAAAQITKLISPVAIA